MKSLIATSFVMLVICLLAAGASAQQASNPPFDFPLHGIEPPEPSNDDRHSWREEDRVLKKGPLAPSENDRLLFSRFLRGRHTGLVRLMPPGIYISATYRSKKQPKVLGGGTYYSFAKLTHGYGSGSDIELDRKNLDVGLGGANYGILTILGDRPLEEIMLNDPSCRFIAQYAPARTVKSAHSESRRFQAGVTIDGALYQSRIPIQAGTTYLLRSIVYLESDELVALRVVRTEANGSVIIAWKRLKKYPAPRLQRK